VLAGLLCAAPLLAVPAQAAAGLAERQELRAALGAQAHASESSAVPLPLGVAPRPAAIAGAELARIASSKGPQRILVGVRAHSQLAGVAAKLRALGATTERLELTGIVAATVPSGGAAAAALSGDPRVAYVERDATLSAATVDQFDTTDDNTHRKFTWAYDAVRAGEALAAVGGGSSRVVSVVDTGLDVTHPEFTGQVRRTFDTRSRGPNVRDFAGHGTFVTGLIAALANNGLGGKGVAGTTKVFAVRATRDPGGGFSLSDLVRGIEYSIHRGARVINLSIAGANFTSLQLQALDAAMEAAFFNDVLPVAAAGNHGNAGNPLEVPAALIGGVRGGRGIGLSVAATRPSGHAAGFSTYNRFVSLAAPGAGDGDCRYGVFSTIPAALAPTWSQGGCDEVLTGVDGPRYAYSEGTSFAAPIVSGLAALAWQAERRLASEQVADVMTRSAAGSGWNAHTGAGVADGMRAVEVARVYDVLAPRARARARRHGNRLRVRVRRSRDRADAGDRLAGHVRYALLVSRDGGRSFRILASRRRHPFTKRVRIRGRRRNVIVSTACDRNGNCGVKRLGPFRRRR
jgi:subtilisin family serine protease